MQLKSVIRIEFPDSSTLLVKPNLLNREQYGASQADRRQATVTSALVGMRHWVEKVNAMIGAPASAGVKTGPLLEPITGEYVISDAAGHKYVFDYCGKISALNTHKEIKFTNLADLARQRLDNKITFQSVSVLDRSMTESVPCPRCGFPVYIADDEGTGVATCGTCGASVDLDAARELAQAER